MVDTGMSKHSGFLIAFCAAGGLTCAIAQEGSKPQLTARELYYSAVQAQPNTAPPKAPAKATPPRKSPPVHVARAEPVTELPDGGRLTDASAPARKTAPAPTAGPALGLRYTILRKAGDAMEEVPPDTVFHTGDRIRVSVQTNGPGYLYIVSQGSSGTWKPIFPSPEVADGDNHVEGWRSYTLPPGSNIVFNEQTGTEKLFIVLSREPEPGFENMIYSLQGRKPVSTPKPQEPARPKQLLTASVNIDDATVGRLRNTYARDLIIEKVDETTPGQKKEKAVYVVNPTGSSDSRVVADLKLVHQ